MNKGYIALSTVLVITAVTLSIAATVALLSIGDIQSSYSLSQGEDAYIFTEGCMEDALNRLASSSAYAGGSFTRPEGTCNISVSANGSTYTLTATSNATDYQRAIQTIATRSSNLTIYSWKEL